MTMTGEQLRAARAMLRLEQAEVAEKAGVSLKTVKRLEAMSGQLDAHSIYALQKAFEVAGIEFVDGDNFYGRGEGVRFRSDRTAKLRRYILDDVNNQLSVGLHLLSERDQDFFERPLDDVVSIVLEQIADGIRDSLRQHLRSEG